MPDQPGLDALQGEVAEGDALVAGNICNTWAYDPDDPEGSGEVVREMYRERRDAMLARIAQLRALEERAAAKSASDTRFRLNVRRCPRP